MCIQLLPNSLYTDVEDEISVDDDPASEGIGVAQPLVSSMLCAWVRLLFYILCLHLFIEFLSCYRSISTLVNQLGH